MEDEAKCVAERDRGLCICGGAGGGAGGAGGGAAALAGSLADVRRAYEERIAAVLASHRPDKLQLQVTVLEEWVRDLTAQNALLATTVEELETTVAGLVPERRRLTESKVSCDRSNALQTLNDKLEKDNLKKEREIKRLRRELQEREKSCAQGPPANAGCTLVVTTSEAQVAAKLCECGPGLSSAAPAPEPDREASEHQQRVQELEDELKSAGARCARCVWLQESVRALWAACAARDRRLRADAQHSHFRDLIAHEMCRQLRAAKAQCVGGRGGATSTSTPRRPRSPRALNTTDDDVRLVDRSPSPPLLVSDASLDERSPVLLCCSAASVADLCRANQKQQRETSAAEDQLKQQKRPATANQFEKRPATELKLQKRPATEEHFKRETKPDKREGVDMKNLSTEPVSLGSSTDSTRARRAEDQLHTTMQILKNKEETVRVQAESLALAEARIADLSRRLAALAHTDRTDRDETPRTRDCSISCCVSAADDDTSAHLEGEEAGALRDKLAAVEGLYRETFYEMARQGEAMDALRRANAQLRSRERRHTARYRELAAEVERLKCDVNDVIGSNSDSGVWGAGSARAVGDVAANTGGETVAGDSGGGAGQGAEYSGARVGGGDAGEGPGDGAGEVAGGLRHVAGQLRRLRDMLACECSCGLAEENKRLKLANDSLERETRELRERVRQLEQSVRDKDSLLHKYEQLGRGKETHDSGAVDALSSHLQLLHGVLNEKSSRLQSVEGKTQGLRERLKKMDSVVKEQNLAVREELSQLSLQVERLRRAGEGAGRTHSPARRNQEESLANQSSFIDLRREQPCTLDGPCARVQARRQERETERCTRVRAGRQQRLSEEPCSQCGSDCEIAPPVPPRRFTKKRIICKDQECLCDADCRCCQVGTCAELHSACAHHTRPFRHGHRSASETLERVAASREAVPSARLRWRRRATTHS